MYDSKLNLQKVIIGFNSYRIYTEKRIRNYIFAPKNEAHRKSLKLSVEKKNFWH